MPTRILIADDDTTIRLLLRRLLEKQPDWQVCGEAGNGVEAIEKVEQLLPDVMVMDLSMPVMTGLQAAPKIVKGPSPSAHAPDQRAGGIPPAGLGSPQGGLQRRRDQEQR